MTLFRIFIVYKCKHWIILIQLFVQTILTLLPSLVTTLRFGFFRYSCKLNCFILCLL